jgi:hypothetical protein
MTCRVENPWAKTVRDDKIFPCGTAVPRMGPIVEGIFFPPEAKKENNISQNPDMGIWMGQETPRFPCF